MVKIKQQLREQYIMNYFIIKRVQCATEPNTDTVRGLFIQSVINTIHFLEPKN